MLIQLGPARLQREKVIRNHPFSLSEQASPEAAQKFTNPLLGLPRSLLTQYREELVPFHQNLIRGFPRQAASQLLINLQKLFALGRDLTRRKTKNLWEIYFSLENFHLRFQRRSPSCLKARLK
ncbi:hypothetical protein D9M69_689270 [compost metagenome]